ncbi:hypothetical protein LY78DRAFT_332573 [Colletotrichum sublineola]|nr:hypothetical protein LY78DRAFT_332573 [Colletotrichum sublineola]
MRSSSSCFSCGLSRLQLRVLSLAREWPSSFAVSEEHTRVPPHEHGDSPIPRPLPPPQLLSLSLHCPLVACHLCQLKQLFPHILIAHNYSHSDARPPGWTTDFRSPTLSLQFNGTLQLIRQMHSRIPTAVLSLPSPLLLVSVYIRK